MQRFQITVDDDDSIGGHVAWARGQEAGIKFTRPLDTQKLLLATQNGSEVKQRWSPRINVIARAILRTHG